jgi:hypothetical protein
MQGTSSYVQSLLVLAPSAVAFGHLSGRLLSSRAAKIIPRMAQPLPIRGARAPAGICRTKRDRTAVVRGYDRSVAALHSRPGRAAVAPGPGLHDCDLLGAGLRA